MSRSNPDWRKSGIPSADHLPWGSHFCQFYKTRKDLLDILIPYLRAGLESNELCVWVMSGTLRERDAIKALEKAVPGFSRFASARQIEFIPLRRWQSRGGKSGKAVLSKIDKAITAGFDGLRLACDFLPGGNGEKFFNPCGMDFIPGNNVIAAFAYPRNSFDALGLMEAVRNHRFALVRTAESWEIIESAESRIAKDELKRNEEKLKSLFSSMSEGFAYHRIVLDSRGRPSDYIFLQVNDAFERLPGLKAKDVLGKRVTAVLPGIEKDPAGWIARFGKVALSGNPVQFENYSEQLKRWYVVSAFSPYKGYFAVTFSDITDRKAGEKALRSSLAEKEILLKELAHRTKNNMQVIASLISLQASALSDKTLLAAFADTQDRIRAMALVHEKLYRSGNVSSLDIKDYLQDLVRSLLHSHQGMSGPVRAELDVQNLPFSIDEAIPCGLIVNELISNSLKHAFSGGKPGTLFLSLKRRNGKVELSYRDDGPGLPKDIDPVRVKTLGLKLVYNLTVRQLRGTLSIRHAPISEFLFTFNGFADTART